MNYTKKQTNSKNEINNIKEEDKVNYTYKKISTKLNYPKTRFNKNTPRQNNYFITRKTENKRSPMILIRRGELCLTKIKSPTIRGKIYDGKNFLTDRNMHINKNILKDNEEEKILKDEDICEFNDDLNKAFYGGKIDLSSSESEDNYEKQKLKMQKLMNKYVRDILKKKINNDEKNIYHQYMTISQVYRKPNLNKNKNNDNKPNRTGRNQKNIRKYLKSLEDENVSYKTPNTIFYTNNSISPIIKKDKNKNSISPIYTKKTPDTIRRKKANHRVFCITKHKLINYTKKKPINNHCFISKYYNFYINIPKKVYNNKTRILNNNNNRDEIKPKLSSKEKTRIYSMNYHTQIQ